MAVVNGDRLHIGIFGRTNIGKSSLVNAVVGQQVAIVSNIKGTTTDPIYKPIELNGVGAVRIIDTAGIDDDSALGMERVNSTYRTLETVDVAILVIGEMCKEDGYFIEDTIIKRFYDYNIPFIAVYNTLNSELNECDMLSIKDFERVISKPIEKQLCKGIISVNALKGFGIDELLNKIKLFKVTKQSITEGFVNKNDCVILVMPQDKSAPDGRLILPQVTVIRELLDIGAIGTVCTVETLEKVLASLSTVDLVITDSQVFAEVNKIIPSNIPLTSFSVLLAAEKGDLNIFMKGAESMDSLNKSSKILIAEACSHVPQNEDIGRVKIPRLLYSKYGVTDITNVGGNDFPADLKGYDLVIHCGACMFNKKLVMNRINKAVGSGIPITNYGIAIAKMTGVLNRIKLNK